MSTPIVNGCKAVLLDLDVTLVDSLDDLTDAVNALLAEEDLPPIDRAAARAMVGDGVGKLVERALRATGGDPDTAAELVPRFLALYEPVATRRTRPFPGVADTLQSLAAELALAVVTNKPEGAARKILADLGLAPSVAAVVGGDTLSVRKPAPEPLLAALRRLGVGAEQAVMVGDNHHDVEAAHAAGMRAIVVAYGYSHRPVAELGADAVIAAFPDLRGLCLPAHDPVG